MTVPVFVLDAAFAAYEAARRRDTGAELEALMPLVRSGRPAVETAMRAWCNRTLMVMKVVMHQGNTQLGAYLEMETRSGETTSVDHVPSASLWAGRMFMAHARQDPDTWDALWATVPPDAQSITDHVVALLHSMAATAEVYAQENQPDLACCPSHADPMLAATRAAMAHYN